MPGIKDFFHPHLLFTTKRACVFCTTVAGGSDFLLTMLPLNEIETCILFCCDDMLVEKRF